MENRLEILHKAKIIDADIYHGMLNVITCLEKTRRLDIRHVQGDMLLTHMANALMRARRGEAISAIDADVLAEVTGSARYPEIAELHHELLQFFPVSVPECEQGYLLANLYGLLLNQAQNVPGATV